MKKFIATIKQTKWWWHLPFVQLFVLPRISRWIFEPDEYRERGWRLVISEYMLLPNIIYFFALLRILGIKM